MLHHEKECAKIVKKVKQILRASNQSLAEIFKGYDNDGSG